MEIAYRSLQLNDREEFWNMMNQLDYETKFMMYEPGERRKDLSRIEKLIQDSVEGTDFLLAAQADGQIVGYISAQRGRLKRVCHSAYVVTGIREGYRGLGIGTRFFRELDLWAEKNNIRRLELTVLCSNQTAKHLYEKQGFYVEGRKQDSMYIDGKWQDEYYMAKIMGKKEQSKA
ncbi:MAG TPA: GNAT family N-acetyltransferase [Candidatus Hungatella pullicola]|nr:GNAT family N-acetyltransferase [Candidatus Hungatella pullicola]